MTNLHNALNAATDDATKFELCDNLWPKNSDSPWLELHCFELYFKFYARQCHDALVDRGQHVLARTHQDIIDIVRQLEDHEPRDALRETLRKKLLKHERPNVEDILDNTIDLAARVYLMTNVCSVKSFISGQIQIGWKSGDLKSELGDHFGGAQILGNDGIKLEPSFTAANLERIAGIQIRPTDNLADHLRLVDQDDMIVAVFHHASFLYRQTSDILPDGLREETLRTLALLFPQHDRPTRAWLSKQTGRFDKMLQRCDPLRLEDRQIEKFHFWHDRLVMLKQAFDHSQPATISQWWFDRRNGVQWYTFWVAVWVLFLTIFFGMVQSIEGALQVYKAYHPAL